MKNEELHQTFVTFLYFSYILYVKESKDKHIRTTGKLQKLIDKVFVNNN